MAAVDGENFIRLCSRGPCKGRNVGAWSFLYY